jgi:hypothetical protein
VTKQVRLHGGRIIEVDDVKAARLVRKGRGTLVLTTARMAPEKAVMQKATFR